LQFLELEDPAAFIAAVNCCAYKVVVLLVPFHLTIDSPFTKFVPFTVNVNAPELESLDVGFIEVLVISLYKL
jgi:hypothetical protein